MKRTSTFVQLCRELLVGEKKSRSIGNKNLELYVIPALKEALLIDGGRGF